jgi:hypothetical protein
MSASKREERIGGQRLILGDCLEVMRELGNVDAAEAIGYRCIGVERYGDYFDLAVDAVPLLAARQ